MLTKIQAWLLLNIDAISAALVLPGLCCYAAFASLARRDTEVSNAIDPKGFKPWEIASQIRSTGYFAKFKFLELQDRRLLVLAWAHTLLFYLYIGMWLFILVMAL